MSPAISFSENAPLLPAFARSQPLGGDQLDVVDNSVDILKQDFIPIAKNEISLSCKKMIAVGVAQRRWIVGLFAAVDFNDEPRFRADEINAVFADPLVLPEQKTVEPPVANARPQMTRSIVGFAAARKRIDRNHALSHHPCSSRPEYSHANRGAVKNSVFTIENLSISAGFSRRERADG